MRCHILSGKKVVSLVPICEFTDVHVHCTGSTPDKVSGLKCASSFSWDTAICMVIIGQRPGISPPFLQAFYNAPSSPRYCRTQSGHSSTDDKAYCVEVTVTGDLSHPFIAIYCDFPVILYSPGMWSRSVLEPGFEQHPSQGDPKQKPLHTNNFHQCLQVQNQLELGQSNGPDCLLERGGVPVSAVFQLL